MENLLLTIILKGEKLNALYPKVRSKAFLFNILLEILANAVRLLQNCKIKSQ